MIDEQYREFIETVKNAADKMQYYEEYCSRFPNLYSQQAIILWEVCKEFVGKNDVDNAFKYVKQYIHLVFSNNKQTISNGNYFSFRPFSEYAIPSIKKTEISLVHPRNFNDPFDPILISWLDNIIRKRENAKKQDQQTKDELETYCLLRKACELLRMRCMVKASDNEKENKIENINPLMWAHYASCHTGFCAEYRITDTDLQKYNSNSKFLKLVPVSYKKDKIMDSSHIELTRALTYKDPIWEYEKEYRLIYFDIEEKDANVANIMNISPEAIYLGFKCSTENELEVRKAIHNTNTKLYRMSVDPNNCAKLKKIRIL